MQGVFYLAVLDISCHETSQGKQAFVNYSLAFDMDQCIYVQVTSRMRTVLFCVITQRVVVIPYRRFGITYRSHLQVSRIQNDSWEH
jgi:hypothetical protein